MEKLNNIVVVTGVSASGKNYLVEKALELGGDVISRSKVFNFGSSIHRIMRDRHPNIYDGSLSLQRAPENELDEAAVEVIDEIVATEGLRIVLNHVAYRLAESVNINPNHGLMMRPRDYIVVTADPEEILKRRIKDDRHRIIEHPRIIDLHQKIAISAVMVIAKDIGSRMTIIENAELDTDINSNIIHEILEGGL